MKNILLILTGSIFLLSCGSKKEEKQRAELPKWLIGEWVSTEDSTTFVEAWTQKNDSLFEGRGMAFKGKDTLFNEKLEMRRTGNDLFYIPTVADQNNGKAIRFKVDTMIGTGFLAINEQHDFPKKIDYHLTAKDCLVAVLIGDEKGSPRREIFRMKKK